MSANFHTPLPDPVDLDTTNLESPLSQLDQGITDLLAGGESFSQLNLGSFTSKTISSGAIVGDATLVTVDTEASASSDDLDTISSPTAGDIMFVKIANNSRVVTLRNNGGGSGNIRTYNGLDFTLRSTAQIALLVHNGSNWMVYPSIISRTTFPFSSATISSGAIAFSGSYMTVDTEGAAATDDLDTISGGALGAFLILSTSNSSRDVTLKHNTGNIMTSTGEDVLLNSSNKFVILVNNSLTWNMVYAPTNFETILGTNHNVNTLKIPDKVIMTANSPFASTSIPFLDLMPFGGLHQPRVLSAADTTMEGFGFGTLTVSGTPSNNGGSFYTTGIGNAVRFQSGGSSGNLGGIISPFTLTSTDFSPYFRCVFATYTSIAVCRLWIGLASAALGNFDTPGNNSVDFMGLRYSTVASDNTSGFWRFVTSNTPALTTSVQASTITAATDKVYELIMYTNGNTSVTFYLRNITDDTAYSTYTTTDMPQDATGLGLNIRIETREAVAKSIQIFGVGLF